MKCLSHQPEVWVKFENSVIVVYFVMGVVMNLVYQTGSGSTGEGFQFQSN